MKNNEEEQKAADGVLSQELLAQDIKEAHRVSDKRISCQVTGSEMLINTKGTNELKDGLSPIPELGESNNVPQDTSFSVNDLKNPGTKQSIIEVVDLDEGLLSDSDSIDDDILRDVDAFTSSDSEAEIVGVDYIET